MLRLLVWLLIAYLVYRMVKGKAPAAEIAKENNATETFQDPVCGLYVSEADAVVGNLEGKRYHFCSMDCLRSFEKKIQQKS